MKIKVNKIDFSKFNINIKESLSKALQEMGDRIYRDAMSLMARQSFYYHLYENRDKQVVPMKVEGIKTNMLDRAFLKARKKIKKEIIKAFTGKE